MDMSEDCWDHVGLLQEVSAAEPPPPPLAPDFLIQQQEVSASLSVLRTHVHVHASSSIPERDCALTLRHGVQS